MILPCRITKYPGLGGVIWLLVLGLAIWLQPRAGAASELELSSNAPAALANVTPTPPELVAETNSAGPSSRGLVENFNTRLAMGRIAVENVLSVLAGGAPQTCVNPAVLKAR